MIALGAGILTGPLAGADEAADDSAISNAIVKISVTKRAPNLFQPWTRGEPSDEVGTGVVIDGKRILTNAHLVTHARRIQVSHHGKSDQHLADVEAASETIDLAVLKLEDEAFFDGRKPIGRTSNLPEVKESVVVYGYPEGGDNLSITKGIVSRIEFTAYTETYAHFGLRVQVDAAINSGNAGGPAMVGDKMIGLVDHHVVGADNIGYIVPSEEINTFLQDVADGHFDGKPAMFDELQTLETDAIRRRLKLDKSVAGMIVRKPYRDDPEYPLKVWDVITRVGTHALDNRGMVQLKGNLRLYFTYLVQTLARDGKVRMSIVRDGKPLEIDLPVGPKQNELVPLLQGRYPSYFIYGPLAFSTVSADLLVGIDANPAEYFSYLTFHQSPMLARRYDRTRVDGEQLVMVVAPMFPHRTAKGYSNARWNIVKDVNGVPIRNLRHLVEVLRDVKEPFVTIRFQDREVEDLIFDHKEVLRSMDEILSDNGIRQQASDDLMPVWNERK
jgi:S1-C subfamily serine protease